MSKIGDEKIVELHKKGLTDREMAEVLGVSQSSVNYRRQRLGLKNNYHEKKKKFDEDKFLELYHLGYTDREIAEKLKLTTPAINYRRVKLELKSNRELPDLSEVMTLHSRGYTPQQIAEDLKVSLALVRVSLEKASV
ncbi:MAG: response regulator transcription factor [Methanomicrobia archaeon]|nr:response regulator transcription factor [Methanomicrobia archaeon]